VSKKLDMTGIAVGTPIIAAKETTDSPTATWAAAAGVEVSATPTGWLEVQAGTGGTTTGYIPYWA
jgi:enoyl reductase-like protein